MLYTARDYVIFAPDLDGLDPATDGLTVEVSLSREPEAPAETWYPAEFVQNDAGVWRVRLLIGPGTAPGQLAAGAWWPTVRVLGLGVTRPDRPCSAFVIEGGPDYGGPGPVPLVAAVISRGEWAAGTPYPEQSLVTVAGIPYLAQSPVPARSAFEVGDWALMAPLDPVELDVSTAALVAADSATAGALKAAYGRSVSIADFGVDPAQTAATNTPLFRAAILAAQTQGLDLFIPWMQAGSAIHINDYLHIDGTVGPGIRVYGQDARGARIVQDAMPQHIFRVSAPETVIEHLDLSMASRDLSAYVSGTRPLILGVADYANHSLIRTTLGADRSTFRHLYLHKTHNGIKIDAWDQANGVYSASNVQGVVIDDVRVEDMWCGVLAQSHDDILIRQVRGKAYSKQVGLGSPPHVIYTYGLDAENRFNNNPRVVDCYGLDGTGGAAFALKFTKGGSASGLSARNCEGLLDLIQLQDTIVTDYTAVDDVYPLADAGASRGTVAIKTSQRVDLVNGAIRVKDGDYAVRALYIEGDNYDIRVRGIRATVNPTTSRAAQPNDVIRVSGRRSSLKDATIVNLGASFYAGAQINATVFDARVEAIKTVGSFRYPIVASGGAGHRIFADPADLPADLAAGAGATPVKLQTAAANSKWFDTSTTATGAAVGAPLGYVNEFAVPDGALPGTSDGEGIGKATTIVNPGTWVVESGRARNSVAPAGGSQAVWDAGTQDGTFRTTFAAIGNGNAALILRTKPPTSPAITLQDYLKVNCITSGTVGRIQLQSRIGGASVTAVATGAIVDAIIDGDVIEVVMAGTSITIKRNGTSILTGTDPDASTDRTYSGLQGTVTGSGTLWERVEFVA